MCTNKKTGPWSVINAMMIGHIKKQCGQKQFCHFCSGEDPNAKECINKPDYPNCENGHISGSSDWEVEEKERSI